MPDPTQDKPQSKVWFAQGRWWAWLPTRDGSAVLERKSAGWRELEHLRSTLAGFPGQADVWPEEDLVRGVLVGNDRLAVIELRYDRDRQTYVPGGMRHQFDLGKNVAKADELETATIARDSRGTWWAACDRARTVLTFATVDSSGSEWKGPITVGEGIASDDISAILSLPGRVGVIWSDQTRDAVFFREHRDGAPLSDWSKPVAVQQGGKNADDHLNGVLADDGTLFVASKNSVDMVGAPQHVLRVRHADGRWANHPYAILQQEKSPTRPISLLAGTPQRLYLLHTIHERLPEGRRDSYIVSIETDPQRLDLSVEKRALSAPRPINNVTGPKRAYPADAPWIFLASDGEGNVYEGRLDP